MSELYLPRLDYPFPVRVSPHARYAEEDCRVWAREIGLVRDTPEARVTESATWSELAARVVPTAEPPAVIWQTRWLAWLGIFDDLAELSHRVPQEWDSVDHGIRDFVHSGFAPGTTAAHPLTRAFRQLVESIPGRLSDGWRDRFSRHLIELLDTCRTESERNDSRVPLSIEEYVVFRRTTGYMPLFYDLHSVLAGSDIPAELRDTVSYQSLQTLSIDAIDWINDIYSLPKEVKSGQVQNIVIVIASTEEISLQDALNEAVVRVRAVLDEFCAAEKEFTASLAGKNLDAAITSQVERNLEGMHDWIVGPADWYPASARYQTTQ